MKRSILFLTALTVLGLGLTRLTNVSAQYMGGTPQEKASDQNKEEQPTSETATKVLDILKATFPDTEIKRLKKMPAAGTNEICGAEFTAKPGKMRAIVATGGDGVILETEEPGDINKFPTPAREAVRKAITGMGVKDLGVRLGRTYAEVQEGTNEVSIVKLPEPVLTYRADVQNNHGEPGKFSFKADGSPLEQPSWAK